MSDSLRDYFLSINQTIVYKGVEYSLQRVHDDYITLLHSQTNEIADTLHIPFNAISKIDSRYLYHSKTTSITLYIKAPEV
ncbi:MAG TPA: hypothetical protein V6C85_24820 [Allocoleopsis sp.]